MDSPLFGIKDFEIYVVMFILVAFSAMEALGGLLRRSRRTRGDWLLELLSFLVLSILTKPGIVLLVMAVGQTLVPEWQTFLHSYPLWGVLIGYLLVDDFLQYWYHRFAHEYEWLWKLHRPHHTAEEMGFFVSYRNAALYYVLMPNIWWIGLVIFLGGAKAVAIGLILKQLVIIGSHSPTKWDQYLYRHKWLHPLAWVVERIFITPAVHFAHHGKSKADGISDPNGNFGNMFFFWDQLFGSALITRQYPKELGLQDDPKDPWTAHMFYPLVKSPKAGSELSEEYQKVQTACAEPVRLELEAGTYLWCQCGFSRNQPFCDGSHHGTKHKPLRFEVEKKKTLSLCQCKLTKHAPFCDRSHLGFLEKS